MPVTYTNTLTNPSGSVPFRKSFRWMNDPDEDAAFLDFIIEITDPSRGGDAELYYRNLTMDRTGEPTVKFDLWEQTGPGNSWEFQSAREVVIGSAESYWAYTTSVSWRNLGVGPMDMNIYWECDERGRAFTIDNLVVP